MKKLLMPTFFALVFSLLAVFTPQAEESSPYALVVQTSDRVLEATKDVKNSEAANVSDLSFKLIEILEPVVDFDKISKAIMGKYYKKAGPDEREAFKGIFKETFANLYAKTLLQFDVESVKVQKPEADKPFKGKMVMTVIAADKSTYTITYSLRKNKTSQAWRVRNVILDGINLGLTYRNQFYGAVDRHQGDLGQVIANWRNEMDG